MLELRSSSATMSVRHDAGFITALALAVACIVLVPVTHNEFALSLGTKVGLNTLLAGSLTLIYRTGRLSFGHVGFMGICAYVQVLSANKWGLDFAAAAGLSLAVTALVAALVAWVSIRFKNIQFVLVTFCFSELMYLALLNFVTVTGGANGITEIEPVSLLGFDLATPLRFYALVWVIALALVICAYWFYKTPLGRSALAIDTNEHLAASTGINVVGVRTAIFIVASTVAGIGGILLVQHQEYAAPDSFTYLVSLDLIVIMVIGGRRSVWGALVGAIVAAILPELLRSSHDAQHIYYGIAVLVILRFLPRGLASLPRRFGTGWARRGKS